MPIISSSMKLLFDRFNKDIYRYQERRRRIQ